MKIVINSCYGGYVLSNKAKKRLAELQGKECYFFNGGLHDDFKSIKEEDSDPWSSALSVKNPQEFNMTSENYGKVMINDMQDDRTNPLLVKVVEELGEDASGQCSNLRVIEIPDGTDYEIVEYDGLESVHEKHKSWS